MKDISRKIIDTCRLGLSLVFLAILATAVGRNADALFASVAQEVHWSHSGTTAKLAPDVATDEQIPPKSNRGEKMSPDGKQERSGATPSHITPVILQWDKSDSRLKTSRDDNDRVIRRAAVEGAARPLRTTPAQVSASLGRQYTLVGARPSGTS
jgi:hypothetical protein